MKVSRECGRTFLPVDIFDALLVVLVISAAVEIGSSSSPALVGSVGHNNSSSTVTGRAVAHDIMPDT
jgi:hypothetical protein